MNRKVQAPGREQKGGRDREPPTKRHSAMNWVPSGPVVFFL